MVNNQVNESVKVYALYNDQQSRRFPHDRLKPILFIWRNRQYRIQDITYVWRENQGDSELYHYAVTDGTNVYELCYEARTFNWTLSSVSCEG